MAIAPASIPPVRSVALNLTSLLVVLALAAGLLAPAAYADGDPASDVLLGENVFYPYQPRVPPAVQQQLNAKAAAAKRAGFPLKVALIASPIDLGVIPDLFNKPQKYANFLDVEISFQGKQPLLVVMPAGYGVQGFAPKAMAAVRSLRPPAGKSSTDLAQAAIVAVAKLAAADGHPLGGSGAPAGASSGGSGATTPIVIAVVVAAAVTASAVIVLRRRQAI